ncbi:MAG: DUF169 domain-containing protein [Oscillospiraceae bacterium]
MKLTKNEWKALNDRLMLALRPTQYPVAMKFITAQEQFDAIPNIQYCENKASVCKLIGMGSHFKGTFALTPDHFSGYYCATNNGCLAVSQDFIDGATIWQPPLCWHHDREDSKKHTAENIKVLPETPYLGVVVSNMAACDIESPDVISLQLPSQAAFHLLAGYVECDYEKQYFSYSGESNCVDTWMNTLKNGKIGVSLGCRGDRATGGLGYGEVRVTMTPEQFVKALDGVDTITKYGIEYPYNPTCMYKTAF